VNHPVLSVFVYKGDLTGSGVPHSVYALDTSKMTKIGKGNLDVGQTLKLPSGVQVTFDGWVPWASLQVSHDPAQTYLLVSALAMVVGLLGSLGVRRRRLWVRAAPASSVDPRSPTVVTVGGLARSDSGNFPSEFAALLDRLRAAGTRVEQVAPASSDAIGAGKD
jgi:cytochrome c biogenesis protein